MADSSSDESVSQKPTKSSKGKYSSEEEDDKTGATQPVVDDEDSDDDDEPTPVAKAKAKSAAAKPAQAIDEDSDDDSDDEPPPKAKVKVGATVAKVTQAADDDSDDDSDDEPPPKAKAKAKAAVAKPAQATDEDSDDDSDDEPPPKATAKAKAAVAKPAQATDEDSDDDSDDEPPPKAKPKAAVAKPAQSDDEDSDDDEPPPVGNAMVKASTPKLAERSAVDDEDSSDDEDGVSRPVAKANAQAAMAKPAKAEDKPRTLKVSGLPKKNVEVVKRAVDAAFSECGKVQSVQVISRGVALVTLESHKHLSKALTLNGNTEKVKGSTLQVEIDKGRPKPDRTKLDGNTLGKGASEPAKTSGGEQTKNTAELKLEIGSDKHTHLKLMQLKVLQRLAAAEKPFDFFKVVQQASKLAKFADEATKHRRKKSEPNKSEPNKSEDRDLDLQVKVTNIAFAAKASEVKQFFVDRCGEASVHIKTAQDGRTKGFARVQLHDTGAVQKALACDGAELCGRPIRVQLASQVPSRSERKALSREAVEGTPAKKKARVEMEDAGEKAPDQKKKDVSADASSEAPAKRKETVVSADAASEAPAKKKAKLVREEVASAAPAKLKEKVKEDGVSKENAHASEAQEKKKKKKEKKTNV